MTARVLILLALLVATAIPAHAAERVIRIGSTFLNPRLGNPYAAIALPATLSLQAVFDSLTAIDETGTVLPNLALSWTNPKATVWIFKLRQGVRFSNGEAFDAAAVVASVEYLTSAEGRALTIGSTLYQLKTARIVDSLTVEITTTQADPIFPVHAAVWRIPAPDAWRKLGPDAFARSPSGTGPFAATKWGPAQISMTAVPGAWRKAKVDGLQFRAVPEQTARLQALTSGALDFVMGLAPEDKATLESAGSMLAFRLTPTAVFWGFITTNQTPLRDVRVRQALNYAVNRQAIIDNILAGSTKPTGQIAFPGAFGYDPTIAPYPYDPTKAKALLAAAGYPDGFSITVSLVPGRGANDLQYQQQIASDLRKIGVLVELRQMVQNQLMESLYKGKLTADAFNMFMRGSDTLNDYRFRSCLHLTDRMPYHCDPAILPTVQKAITAASPQETERLTHDVLAYERDNPPGLFLWQGPEFDGIGPKLSGYRPVQDVINYHELTLRD